MYVVIEEWTPWPAFPAVLREARAVFFASLTSGPTDFRQTDVPGELRPVSNLVAGHAVLR